MPSSNAFTFWNSLVLSYLPRVTASVHAPQFTQTSFWGKTQISAHASEWQTQGEGTSPPGVLGRRREPRRRVGRWGGFCLCSQSREGRLPLPRPRCPSCAPLPLPRPWCLSRAPVSLLRPRRPRVSGAPTTPRLHSRSRSHPHQRTRTAGPAPPGVPAGGPEPRRRAGPDALLPGEVAAQGSAPRVRAPLGNRGGRGCAGHGKGGQGRRAAGPGGSGSGDSAPRVSRNAARAELTGVGAAKWRSIRYWPQTPL